MRLQRRVVLFVGLAVLVAAAALVVRRFAFAAKAPAFRFATVERGDLQALVSATGTLDALTTVSVGTQVSGQVSELLVDFNDRVRKGQLLARIDPTLAQQGVADGRANLEKLQAQATQASRDQNRNRELSASGLIATSALEQGGAALLVAQAGARSAGIALQRAQQNLSYTAIYAPIDGVVVERNVSKGQTVAASLSAPQLFLIANDLAHMQILAQVGESDIQRIRQGQAVRFTVQAIPGHAFAGVVQQVRLQSKTVDNVVNYTVVVTLENPAGTLLPGMTARVDFLVAASTNVLKVKNAALRYRPSAELLTQLGAAGAPAEKAAAPSPRRSARSGDSAAGSLYFLDAKGKLQRARVRTGISDGVATEVEGPGVSEGLKVVDGLVSAAATSAQAPAANPLAGGSRQGGGPRGPGGF